MSTSTSIYDPEENDEASDNGSIGPRDLRSGFGTSLPPLQNLGLASASESSRRSRESSIFSRRSHARTRANILRTHRKVPIDRYLDFFDASVQDTVNGQAYGDGVHDTTQNGIVTWTSKEKDVLFNALARKGRNAISQIAALIGSKCEMEVRDYLDLLQRGLVHQH